MTRVVGIDPSLTATGLAVVGNGVALASCVKIRPANLRGHERMDAIREVVLDTVDKAGLVVIEGPSYGSSAGQAGHHERAGLWWLLTRLLWQADIPYAVMSPSGLKKYITGKGNADKDSVLAAVVRRYGEHVVIDNNNAADAFALAAAGADHLGEAIEPMPETHRAALAKVDWPEERL